jgi:hypothetical protein
MVYRGIKTITIDHIIGSEGRYSDFDINFLPKQEHTRSRWENIDVARLEFVDLPPISAYKLGDFYFVKDGNHRVSVAREMGQEFIDAEVIELFTRVNIDKKHLNEKGLLLAESYKYFLDKTGLDTLVYDADIRLTHPWGYYRLLEHINTYKYLLSEKSGQEVEWKDAVKWWYEELYLNVVKLIHETEILERFPGRTEGDLYIWGMDHWHYLKEEYGNIDIKEALHNFSVRFGESKIKVSLNKVKKWFYEKVLGRK